MRRVQLRLGGVDADLPEGGNVAPALVLQLAELGKTASIVGDGAKRSVKLPATAINRAALATGRADCVVVVDGVQVFTGTAIVSERNNIRGRQQTVSINLVSGNVSALGAVFDVRLADLDWSDTEHDLTSAEVSTGLGYLPPPLSNYGYNPIMRGRWVVSGQVQHYECTPYIFLGAAIERALQQIAGYTLGSNFLKDSIFKGLCMPVLLPEKYGDDFARDYTQETWEVISYDVPEADINPAKFETAVYTNPNNPSWDGVSEYTCPYDGFYNMKAQLIVEPIPPTAGTMLVNFVPRQNGVTYNVQYSGAQIQVGFFIPTTGQTLVSLDVIFDANAGDVLDLLIFMPALGQMKLVSGRIDIVGEAKVQSGSPILFKYLLGDTTVGDIIRGLTHAFNLVWSTNQFARTVKAEPADDWYNVRTAAIESGFYSQTETQNLPEDLSREQKISYFQAPKSWMRAGLILKAQGGFYSHVFLFLPTQAR